MGNIGGNLIEGVIGMWEGAISVDEWQDSLLR